MSYNDDNVLKHHSNMYSSSQSPTADYSHNSNNETHSPHDFYSPHYPQHHQNDLLHSWSSYTPLPTNYGSYSSPSHFPTPSISPTPPPPPPAPLRLTSPTNTPLLTLAGSLDPATGIFYRSPEHPRLRTAQACEKCRTRKAKCSGEHPSCKRCFSRGLVCEYAKEGRVRGPNKPKPNTGINTASTSSQPPNSPLEERIGSLSAAANQDRGSAVLDNDSLQRDHPRAGSQAPTRPTPTSTPGPGSSARSSSSPLSFQSVMAPTVYTDHAKELAMTPTPMALPAHHSSPSTFPSLVPSSSSSSRRNSLSLGENRASRPRPPNLRLDHTTDFFRVTDPAVLQPHFLPPVPSHSQYDNHANNTSNLLSTNGSLRMGVENGLGSNLSGGIDMVRLQQIGAVAGFPMSINSHLGLVGQGGSQVNDMGSHAHRHAVDLTQSQPTGVVVGSESGRWQGEDYGQAAVTQDHVPAARWSHQGVQHHLGYRFPASTTNHQSQDENQRHRLGATHLQRRRQQQQQQQQQRSFDQQIPMAPAHRQFQPQAHSQPPDHHQLRVMGLSTECWVPEEDMRARTPGVARFHQRAPTSPHSGSTTTVGDVHSHNGLGNDNLNANGFEESAGGGTGSVGAPGDGAGSQLQSAGPLLEVQLLSYPPLRDNNGSVSSRMT